MMEERKDGGGAFAMPASEHSLGGHHEQYGMSLRDYFAGQALAGLMAHGGLNPLRASETAYRMADAMIAVREESQ